jgi:hypothetical protein
LVDFEKWNINRYVMGWKSWIPSIKSIDIKQIKQTSKMFSKNRLERDKKFIYLFLTTAKMENENLYVPLEGVGESVLFSLFKKGMVSLYYYLVFYPLNSISNEHSTEELKAFNDRVSNVCELLIKTNKPKSNKKQTNKGK